MLDWARLQKKYQASNRLSSANRFYFLCMFFFHCSPRLETGWAKCVSDFRAQAEEVYLATHDGEVTVRRVDGYPAIQPGKFFEATKLRPEPTVDASEIGQSPLKGCIKPCVNSGINYLVTG